ncbi:MAG TPA: PAS domain-containing protein [Azonexus sp.]
MSGYRVPAGHDDLPHQWLEATLASVDEAVLATDVEGRIEFLNPAARSFLGVAGEAARGRRIDELLEITDLKDGPEKESPLHQAMRLGRQVTVERGMVVRLSDRRSQPAQATARPVRAADGSLLGGALVWRRLGDYGNEIVIRKAYAELDRRAGERRQALERAASVLRDSSLMLEAFAANTPELIFVKDREQRILMVNPATLQALGMSQEEVIGRNDLMLFCNPEDSAHIRASDRAIIEQGETITLEQRQLTPAGLRVFLVTKSPLRDDEGRVIGVVGVATDITEHSRAQSELERLLAAEHRLRGEAERANRAKDEFLAIVSHELRSPLNALKGWSHVLSNTASPDPALLMRGAEAIRRNVEHQARLIDDLLDTSSIISGKLEIERHVVNLVDVVHAAIELSRNSARAKQIELAFATENPVLTVLGDPGRLSQVVINLLSNAIKFTLEHGRVDIALHGSGNRVRLTVADTGIGIEPDFLPHVFNRFSQADSSAIRRYRGLGIGLALVRYLVELHGGSVAAASPGVGQGATFTAEFPLHYEIRSLREMPEQTLPLADALLGVRIMLVDDDPDAREIIMLALRHVGADVQAFESGRALLEALHDGVGQAAPDILLFDIAMPEQSGFQLLADVRALAGLPFIPAVAVTALTHMDRRQFGLAGFQECIGKPLDLDRLIEIIAGLAGPSATDTPAGQQCAS